MEEIMEATKTLKSGVAKPFSVRIHGKWILVGEHAVLRGCPALAFPVYGKSLNLIWQASNELHGSAFSTEFSGERGAEFQLLFAGVFDRALEILGRSGDLGLKNGHFQVESTLPVGAGLGASAALAVAVGKWFANKGAIEEANLFEFCREIENLFHGESSGVDVAVALESRGLYFERGIDGREGVMRAFDCAWEPTWYISYSGSRGITSECVAQVKAFIERQPSQGSAVDSKMVEAVSHAQRSLLADSALDSGERFELLRQAIDLGYECFAEWDLLRGDLGHHLQDLRRLGAVAVKPTGSGGGGYALSLWHERPSVEIERQLIPVFRKPNE